ncbi:MAG: hemolysin family protein [Actinomycetota bacterium]|nr:hemolysin family protein [Actinomycetota bacterium]
MVPRPDIVALPAHTPVEEALQVALSAGHGRLPLYEGTIDNITGVVHLRDLVRAMDGEGGEPVLRLSRPPLVVPESKRVVSLLREMQEAGSHLAVVVDEYGGTSGLVTIEDVMEELVGEVADEGEEEQPAELHRIEEGRWLVDGGMLVEDLESLLEAGLPEGDWHTVGGLVMGVAGKVPSTGDEVVIGGFSFRVTSASRRRIRQVQIERRGSERR